MKKSFIRLKNEPLVHFLLIGAAVFMFYNATNEQGSTAPNRIVVSSGKVEQLAANYKRTWMRLPTQEKLDTLIDNYVREEVYYREALAMGLDQNDPLVRMRMRMKMEYILKDLSSQNVTDEDLAAYLKQNPDKFRKEAQVSFQQILLSYDKRKNIDADAKQLLINLNNTTPKGDANKISPENAGDPTMLAYDFQLETKSGIERTFGKNFTDEIVKLSPGKWIGPVYSEYGGHLLKITEHIAPRQLALEAIRAVVKREYLAQRIKEQKNLAYQQLRKGYEVTIEPGASLMALEKEVITTAQANKM